MVKMKHDLGMSKHWIYCCIPIFVALVVFFQVHGFESILYDDPSHLYENENVNGGFTADGVKWSFTQVADTNLWHPATWISYMLDVELFGLNGVGAHHLMSLALHLVSVATLYFLLLHYSKSPWVALILCCIWAVHPHRVHNVAWLSQRKDVLSMVFLLLSWLAWVKAERKITSPLTVLSLTFFTLSLMSKASGIGLPLILFVSDYVLQRKKMKQGIPILLGFSALSAGVAGLAIYFQNQGGLGGLDASSPLLTRFGELPYTLWWYIENTVYSDGALWVYSPVEAWRLYVIPVVGLALVGVMMYPFRKQPLVLLGVIIVLAFWLPVSGITSVSFYKVAERYSYFIQLGYLFVAMGVLSMVKHSFKSLNRPMLALGLGGCLCLIAGVITHKRTGLWQDSQTLFEREAVINPKSLLAQIFLGIVEVDKGELKKAVSFFEKAVELDPESGLSLTWMGDCYRKLGQIEEAKAAYQRATTAQVLNSSIAFQELASLWYAEQDYPSVEKTLKNALEKFPNDFQLNINLGHLYFDAFQDYQKALTSYNKSLEIEPENKAALFRKGDSLIQLGEREAGEEILRLFKSARSE